jgi:hypothetical protein
LFGETAIARWGRAGNGRSVARVHRTG